MNLSYKYLVVILILILISCNNQKAEIQLVNELPNSPHEINPIKIGSTIPKIILKDINGYDFDLIQNIKLKPTILIYYRGGWCLYCNAHLGHLQEIEQELFNLGYQIIAVSADLSEKIKKTIEKHKITYTMVTDKDLNGAIALGLAFNVGKEYEKMLPVLEEFSGNKKHILPVPAAFVVNKQGVVQFVYINPNSNIRIAPELLLTAAKVALNEN